MPTTVDHEFNVDQLIDRARKGDRNAFDELVNHFSCRLRESIEKWSRFRLHTRVDADDVLQETFLRAYRSLERFEAADPKNEESFLRWICGIAKHALGDLARKAANCENPAASIERVAGEPSQSRVQRREERFDRLQRALDKLPPDYRRVLILSRLEGLSAQEIAERMGRTPNAVYHLIGRALQLLRERFGDTESLHLPDRPLRREGGDHGA
jgi:RNA polymerase sigma-70 factor (ECF subfamily)